MLVVGGRWTSALLVAFFVEVGGFLVAAVRLTATVLGERVVPEHLIFSFGSLCSYAMLGTLRTIGAMRSAGEGGGSTVGCLARKDVGDEDEESTSDDDALSGPPKSFSSHPQTGDSWSLGLLELVTAVIHAADGILRVSYVTDLSQKDVWGLRHVSGKALLKFPYFLLIPMTSASMLAFSGVIYFHSFDGSINLRHLMGVVGARPWERLVVETETPAGQHCRHAIYAVAASPLFIYVDSVLILSVVWMDKDNIMAATFAYSFAVIYLAVAGVHILVEFWTPSETSTCGGCTMLAVLLTCAGVVHAACAVAFGMWRTGIYGKCVCWFLRFLPYSVLTFFDNAIPSD
jgi:hypothetical protein